MRKRNLRVRLLSLLLAASLFLPGTLPNPAIASSFENETVSVAADSTQFDDASQETETEETAVEESSAEAETDDTASEETAPETAAISQEDNSQDPLPEETMEESPEEAEGTNVLEYTSKSGVISANLTTPDDILFTETDAFKVSTWKQVSSKIEDKEEVKARLEQEYDTLAKVTELADYDVKIREIYFFENPTPEADTPVSISITQWKNKFYEEMKDYYLTGEKTDSPYRVAVVTREGLVYLAEDAAISLFYNADEYRKEENSGLTIEASELTDVDHVLLIQIEEKEEVKTEETAETSDIETDETNTSNDSEKDASATTDAVDKNTDKNEETEASEKDETPAAAPAAVGKPKKLNAPSLKSVKIDDNKYVSKTSNIDNNGKATSQYKNSQSITDKVTIPDAVGLIVTVQWAGEGVGCDYLMIRDASNKDLYTDATGKAIGNTNNSSYKGRIGGNATCDSSASGTTTPVGKATYEFEGDTLNFYWKTDGSVTGYGYYAVIEPVFAPEPPAYHMEEKEDGTFKLVFDKGGDIDGFVKNPDVKAAIGDKFNKISEIQLNKNTTSVVGRAFEDLGALTTVTFPRNCAIEKIGNGAFKDCQALKELNIPSSVKTIEGTPFSGCTDLKKVTFAEGSPITTLPASIFKGCGSLETVTLPEGLTAVPAHAFDGCTKLDSITLPDTVTSVGDYAFYNSGLKETPEWKNITKIGNYAFSGCKSLEDVSIPNTITSLGQNAFQGCTGMKSFVFEEGSVFETLPAGFFNGCSSLTHVVLPEHLKAIPNDFFYNCTSLKKVDFPENVATIGNNAFRGCTSLRDFDIPASVKSIGTSAFLGCTSLKDMVIPKTVQSVGSGLFQSCTGLIRAEFEEGSPITSLPSSMFNGCSHLETIILPERVTAIPASYFRDCTSLEHITLPANLTSIGEYAFYNCYNLNQLELPNTLKTIDNYAFSKCDKFTDIFIPKSVTSLGSYVWQDCTKIRSVEFEAGSPLTSIGTYTFKGCTSLQSLILPERLTSIPNYMCQGCTKLKTVKLPANVTSIGSYAFSDCSAMTHIDFPNKLTTINSRAFYRTSLKDIDLPASMRYIYSYAFGYTDIKDLYIPKNVSTLDSSAFRYCDQLESVVFEEGGNACSLGQYVFSACPRLSDVTLKSNIATISAYAFYQDPNLKEAVIPSSVTQINNYAFAYDRCMERIVFQHDPSNRDLKLASNGTANVFTQDSAVKEIVIDRNVTSSYTGNNFAGISPGVNLTIGKHVDKLDNMFVSMLSNESNVVFEGENDFSVTTRIANSSTDVKWSEFKGDFYVDSNGAVYKLNKTDHTASLFHVPDGITEYNIPTTITSVAGAEYTVTSIHSYAFREADDLTALTVETPANITIPQFAFTGCESLATINGEPELYSDEWVSVSLLCDFPVHTEKEPQQVLMILSSTELGAAGDDGQTPRFSFGVSISGQNEMADDGLTYEYLTGQSARLDFSISNESNMDMSDRVIRIYFAFDGENYTMGNYSPGQQYTLVNDATGARYPFTVGKTDAKGVYYYDITGFKPGDTLAFNNNFAYLSPISGGGTMRVWAESISAQEAAQLEGKVSEPSEYILAHWSTIPTPYNVKKSINGNPQFRFAANSSNTNDDNIYVQNLNYAISMNSGGASGTSLGKDYVKYVDFEDDLKLPEGMIWSPSVIEAVKAGDYYINTNNYIYAKVDGAWIQVGYMTFSDSAMVRSMSVKVVTDDNGNEALRICWSYKNTYWSNTMTAPTADMPATNHYLYLGNQSVQVKRDSDLWLMLREGDEYTAAESDAMRTVNNKVKETTHYSYSEPQTKEAVAQNRLVYMNTGFSMSKSSTGSTTFGMPHGFNISLTNSGLTHKKDIDVIDDTLANHYYLEASDIETLLKNAKWGKYAQLDIIDATFCTIPEKTVVDVHGTQITNFTAQQMGIEPIPYSGRARSDASEEVLNGQMTIRWNEDHTKYILEKKDVNGNVLETFTIGEGEEYKTIQDVFDAIGYVVVYRTKYKVTWNLGEDYVLKSGTTDTFNIPSRTKKTTMWLTEDTPTQYPSSSVYSQNTAYARNESGGQVGSANWTGYVYRELSLSKSAWANGRTWGSNISIPDDTVIDYTLSFTNNGAAYDVMPLADKMGGSQVLLVPVRGNKSAQYYADEASEGVALEDAGLDIYTEDGIQYYVFDKAGTYKGVTIDGRIADTIQVNRGQGAIETLMIWYYKNVTGNSTYASSVTRSITYKALADSSRISGTIDDGSGSSVTNRALANEAWLGGHQTHRLYATLHGGTEAVQFDKWISETDGGRESLYKHSLIQQGEEVLYKMIIRNTSELQATITGKQIHDELPTTSGIFPWNKDNVQEVYYVTENLGSSVETAGDDDWYVSSSQPGTGTDTASRGQYYIYWKDSFKIHMEPKGEVWIYVKLKFPGTDEVDPSTGDSNNHWDDYITKNNGSVITNYFYLNSRQSNVTHELMDVVEGKLQKGVLDTGLARSGYFQSEDTRHYYQNGGNVDNGSIQEVAYYTVLYNSGNVRMYLDDLQDQLPKGFQFRGLINYIPTAARTQSGFSTANSAWNYNSLGSYYNQFNTLNYTEYRMLNNASSSLPVATVHDPNRTVTYKNARVTATTTTVNDHQQVKFSLSRQNSGNTYLKYDTSLNKYYLDPGEAVRFGYICAVEGYARTENIATNEVAMPMYDKYGMGVVLAEDVEITPTTYRDIPVNDGGCDKLSADEEELGYDHTRPAWARNTTEWFSSNVSLTRLSAVPGILKTVGGETLIPSTTTISPNSIYGSRYTDGSKGGVQYTGTVARTSIVNWNINVYNEGGIGSNSLEDFTIVDTVDAPYRFTGNFFYDYYSVSGVKMTNASVPIFSIGGRSENDKTVKISTGQGSSTLSLDGTLTINGNPVNVDGGRATVQLLRDEDTGIETLIVRIKDNYHRIPPNSYMSLYGHTQYCSSDAVLSKQFYNHVQLETKQPFDPALVSQGRVLYREVNEEIEPYAIESGASVTMTAGYSSAAKKQVTELDNTSNTGWSDQAKNFVELPEKYSKFRYDLYVNLPKDDPTSRLVLIDALPEPGDHSAFVDRDVRESEFIVHMLSENLGFDVWSIPNAGSGTKKLLTTDQYSFEVNTRTEFDTADWAGNGDGWVIIDLSDGLSPEETELVENARSFRVIIDDPNVVTNPTNGLMGKNHQIQIRFNAELLHPEDADPGSIAWNSFGYRYTVPIGQTGMSTSLNAEPLKVGVLIPSVPVILKDLKTPLNHYKKADMDTTYRFLVYSGSAIAGLNDTSQMTLQEIAQILTENNRDVLLSSLTIHAGEDRAQTDFLDEEKKWAYDATAEDFVPTEDNWVWRNAQKYTILELPWAENGFVFSDILHSVVNNYTFTQTTEKNINLRVTNVYNRKGSLKLQKTVTGTSFDPERKFTFTIHMQDGKYPVYGTFDYKGTNIRDGSITFDDNGNASIQLKHNQAIEIMGIPDGYTYSVSEAADTWYVSNSANASGSIVTNTVANVSFVNTRIGKPLSIKKTITGMKRIPDKKFRMEVYVSDESREINGTFTTTETYADGKVETGSITFTDGVGYVEVQHGETVTINNLPIGARYEVDETVASREGFTASYDHEIGVLTADNTTVGVTNEFISKSYDTELKAKKSVLPSGSAAGYTFTLYDKDDKVIATKQTDEKGEVTFPITITGEDLYYGTPLVYKVREQLGLDSGMQYDSDTAYYAISATKQATGYTTTVYSSKPMYTKDSIQYANTLMQYDPFHASPADLSDVAYVEYDPEKKTVTIFRDVDGIYSNREEQAGRIYYTGIESSSFTGLYDMLVSPDGRTHYGDEVEHVRISHPIKPVNVANMFNGLSSCRTIDMAHLDTSDVTDMKNMFKDCSSLNVVDLTHCDVSSVSDMSGMFEGCQALRAVYTGDWSTAALTTTSRMFKDCENLTSFDVSVLEDTNLTDASYMFAGCSSLNGLDLSEMKDNAGYDTTGIADGMSHGFIDLTSWSKDYGSEFSDTSGIDMAIIGEGYKPKETAWSKADDKWLDISNAAVIPFSDLLAESERESDEGTYVKMTESIPVFTNKSMQEVKVTKKDDSNNLLAGAKLALIAEDGREYIFTTGTNGTSTVSVPAGTYELHEINVPNSWKYAMADKIVVNADCSSQTIEIDMIDPLTVIETEYKPIFLYTGSIGRRWILLLAVSLNMILVFFTIISNRKLEETSNEE